MDLTKALDQLADIHQHLHRTEVYRGYRSQTIAFTGLVALAGAMAQPSLVGVADNGAVVLYWATLAALNVGVVALDIICDYYRRYSLMQRRMTLRVVGQFLPALAVGAVITYALFTNTHQVGLLPGLWSLVFATGLFASRPYLPQGVGWVGLFYLVTGATLLLTATSGLGSPWLMGVVFGGGQLALSAVLYWNLERKTHV